MSWDFIVSALAKQVGEEGMKTIGTEAAKTVAKQGLKLTAEETAKLVAKETAKKAAWEVTKKGGEKFVQGQLTKKATEATMAAVTPGDEESLTKYGANDLFSLALSGLGFAVGGPVGWAIGAGNLIYKMASDKKEAEATMEGRVQQAEAQQKLAAVKQSRMEMFAKLANTGGGGGTGYGGYGG